MAPRRSKQVGETSWRGHPARRIRLLPIMVFLWWSHAMVPLALADEVLRIGVLAFRPAAETISRWQPTADYLGEHIQGVSFEIVPLGYHEMGEALASRDLDLVLTNPSHYISLLQKYQAERIATLIASEQGVPVTAFGGVIAVRAQADAPTSIAGLKGRRVASPQKGSLGGYQVQAMELVRAGLNPERDVEMVFTDMPHDRALETLLQGRADAAFVRTGLIESMAAEGLLDPSQLRVLNRQVVPSFPFLLSTRLYPEWPIAALPHLDAMLSRKIAIALVTLDADHPATLAGGYLGWAVPADYEPVRALLETLALPPYDEAVPAWRTHSGTRMTESTLWLLGLLGLLALAVLAALLYSRLRCRQLGSALGEALALNQTLTTRLATISAACPQVMTYRCRQDAEWTMVHISDNAERVTGYPPEMFLNGQIVLCDLIHPDDIDKVRQNMDAARPDAAMFDIRYRLRHADGGFRTMRAHGLCTPDRATGGHYLDCAAVVIATADARDHA